MPYADSGGKCRRERLEFDIYPRADIVEGCW
jgi:hypothetical protein